MQTSLPHVVYGGSTAALLKRYLYLYFHVQGALWIFFFDNTASSGKLLLRLFCAMAPKYLLVGYFWDIVRSPVNVPYSLSPWQLTSQSNKLEILSWILYD